jgi:protein required for attachment to host cells
MKPVVTLYCIADEAGFRLLRGTGPRIEELLTASAEAFDDVEYEFSKGGRNRAGTASFGHDTKSAAEIERPRLARHVIRALEAEWAAGRADRIVLAAGPKMLGALRDVLPEALKAQIAAELPKDLSSVPAHELADHLSSVSKV